MDHVPEFDDPTDVPEWLPGDPDYSCKHCDQLGVECDVCHGEGVEFEDEIDADDPPPCPKCNGEGVLPISKPTETTQSC